MRVSEHYRLGLGQGELDFVDVDIRDDTALFVDPQALRRLRSQWGHECVSLIQDFFQTVIRAIRDGDDVRAQRLLAGLSEPNETHLGLSWGRSQGRGMGEALAFDLWESLSTSRAVATDLLADLEDAALLVEGIGPDIISDIATNLIRGPLIRYTQAQAAQYAIPLVDGVASGRLWDPRGGDWYESYERLPVAGGGRLLLVPKVIVRKRLGYDPGEYFRYYVLTYLQDQHMAANSELVELLRNGSRRVTKTALIERYGQGKATIVDLTLQHPEILERYREAKRRASDRPLSHEDMADATGSEAPDWDGLLNAVLAVEPGRAGADDYAKAVAGLLAALFYPALDFPVLERPIHEGRKRIDVTFTNEARDGFFAWLRQSYVVPFIFAECKNYSSDPENPELDQLSGRFSRDRGNVGLLVCRSFEDKELFIQRCRDTAADGRGFIIPLDDDDLRELVEARKASSTRRMRDLLQGRFERLVMNT